jgi:hypothetical protein
MFAVEQSWKYPEAWHLYSGRLMIVMGQSGAHPQIYLERYRILAIGGIQSCGLGVEGKLTAQR